MTNQFSRLMSVLVFVLAAFASSTAFAQVWETYTADDYGFSMLVPSDAVMTTQDFGGGWGGLYAETDDVAVFGIAKLGAPETAEAIEAFGVEVTEIPAASWTLIDEGSGDGWNWYRTVEANAAGEVLFGGYGVGPNGNYMMLLVTTPEVFATYRADFDTWYGSIQLF